MKALSIQQISIQPEKANSNWQLPFAICFFLAECSSPKFHLCAVVRITTRQGGMNA